MNILSHFWFEPNVQNFTFRRPTPFQCFCVGWKNAMWGGKTQVCGVGRQKGVGRRKVKFCTVGPKLDYIILGVSRRKVKFCTLRGTG